MRVADVKKPCAINSQIDTSMARQVPSFLIIFESLPGPTSTKVEPEEVWKLLSSQEEEDESAYSSTSELSKWSDMESETESTLRARPSTASEAPSSGRLLLPKRRLTSLMYVTQHSNIWIWIWSTPKCRMLFPPQEQMIHI